MLSINKLSVSILSSPTTGKSTKAQKSAANLIKGSSVAATLGAALHAKGAIKACAAHAFNEHTVTLGKLLSLESIDGSQWGDLRMLLAGRFPRETASHSKGKSGCIALCKAAVLAAEVDFLRATEQKSIDRTSREYESAMSVEHNVMRLFEAAAVEAAAVEAAAVEAA